MTTFSDNALALVLGSDFVGQMAGLAVYKTELSATQVAAHYAARLTQGLTSVGAIGSAEAFGVGTVAVVVGTISAVGAIGSAEAFGTVSVTFGISAIGAIPSAEAFGTAVVTFGTIPALQSLSDVGAIGSAETFGPTIVVEGEYVAPNVGGIASAEAFGTIVVTTLYPLADVGNIASGEAFGAAVVTLGTVVLNLTTVGAIAGAEAFGTAVVTSSYNVVNVGAIPSSEAFGLPTVTNATGVQPIYDVGAIGSAETFGSFFVSMTVSGVGGIDTDELFGTTIVERGVLPPRWASAYEYVIELFSRSSTFGPATKVGEIWDARNLGWSRYDRLPGRGFFTLYQDSPHLASIIPIITHVRVTRVTPAGSVEVFNGIVSDYNSTGDDVVFDIYDYVSLLSLSRSGYRTLYPTKLIGTEIVAPEWALAQGATKSSLGFVVTGTIENPLGSDNVTTIKTNAQFGLMDQMRLALFYDLTEMGRANTVNHVTYEITRIAPFTFNFWKNKGSAVNVPLVLNGTVSDYQFAPNWASYRNDLATLGTTLTGGATEVVKTDSVSAAAFGRRQDVFAIKTLAGTGALTVESDQQQAVAARMLKTATDGVSSLWLTLVPGTISPFVSWDICDRVPVEIVNGTDSITGYWRIVGARAIMDESGERLQVLVAKVLT